MRNAELRTEDELTRTPMDFRLPALGEGIDSATVVGVLVKPGDAVKAGQPVVSVETDKAAVDVPIESAGSIATVHVKPGDKLSVGSLILSLTASANGVAPNGGNKPPVSSAPPAAAPTAAAAPAQKEKTDSPASVATGPVDFALPALGEGIDSATVVGVLVKVGDTIKAEQPVVSVETDKAAVDVPCDVAGSVTAIHVKPGDKLGVGSKILTIQASGGRQSAVSASTAPQTQTAASAPAPTKPAPKETGDSRPPVASGPKSLIPAGPATRRLARELGVGLAEVQPTGRGGRVTLDDIKGFVKAERTSVKTGGGTVGGSVVNAFTLPPLPDFAKFGEIEKKPVAKIRETIAKNLTVAWRTMPMVTQNDLADITDLEAGRKRVVESLPKGAPKITWTVLAVKAVVAALKEFPQFNSSYDMNAGEVILKKYFHIGIAVDTERGLVVPVIKDADKKSVRDIAAEVASLAEKARAGKLGLDEMRGGSFTITNLGGIGGTSFTPIVNYPEVAILGMCRSALQPVVREGKIEIRLMLPLSLTYDHRVIDGADGARFASRLCQLFSDPMRLLMES
jgi:pyruvate dehydrogenase E2 component (dihydrolipoamide acetyltransferase)